MRFRDPGYTPAFRELDALLELVGQGEEAAERAILRIDAKHQYAVVEAVVARARAAQRPARAHYTHLAGRMMSSFKAREWLIEALADADMKTRRTAARALSKIEPTWDVREALIAAWDRGNDDDRRAIAEALGRQGGAEARKRLGTSLDKKAVRASLILDRDESRKARDRIDLEADPGHPVRVRWHCRRGMEAILEDELLRQFQPEIREPGGVDGVLVGTLSRALEFRTATHVSFPLGMAGPEIVDTLLTDHALEIFRAFTKGRPIRFRLAWDDGKHHRAEVWDVADVVRKHTKELVNDPHDSTWEVRIDDEGALDLVPKGFEDPRFLYRRETVPASSHPTIAAAIARLAPRTKDDVIWDPFVGAGAELVERAILGRYARMIGTDSDPKALRAARRNLAGTDISNVTIEEGDALTYRPEGVNVILTNPPMGRRVQRGTHKDLLSEFAKVAVEILPPGGTLVWVVPDQITIPPRLRLEKKFTIDMGGFPADLAVYQKRR